MPDLTYRRWFDYSRTDRHWVWPEYWEAVQILFNSIYFDKFYELFGEIPGEYDPNPFNEEGNWLDAFCAMEAYIAESILNKKEIKTRKVKL